MKLLIWLLISNIVLDIAILATLWKMWDEDK